METTLELVTPKKAEAWLNANNSNRKLREGVAEKYADDMRSDRWTECPEPISFYTDGELADGQHRLWAIIDAGTAIKFNVTRNLSREAGLNLNTGLTRSLVDNARISGADRDLSNELISVCRAIEDGDRANGGKTRSNADRLALVDTHREAGKWACSNGPRGKLVRNTLILAAVGRAWYHEGDKDRLRRFCDVMSTGFSEGEGELAGIAFREYLREHGASASAALWRDTFFKAQNAISYFMRSKKLTIIKVVKEEAYPLRKKAKRS